MGFNDKLDSGGRAPSAHIPEVLRGLDTVAIAVIGRDGVLRDGNRGFLQLLAKCGGEAPGVHDLFVDPPFERLAVKSPDPFEGIVYRGLIGFATGPGRSSRFRATVYLHDRDLLVVAEHDVGELASLRDRLERLSEDLAERHRAVLRLEEELAETRELADSALRDRDILLEALSQAGKR